jgi:hypothetical protein
MRSQRTACAAPLLSLLFIAASGTDARSKRCPVVAVGGALTLPATGELPVACVSET